MVSLWSLLRYPEPGIQRRVWEGVWRASKLDFSETLIPYQWNTDWIPSKLKDMMKTLNSDDIPLSNESCENCAYARERSIYDKTS